MEQDPHAVLGVPRGVSFAALKRAFRSRARATHPDHGGARADFEAVVAAFEALRDEAALVVCPPRSRWPYADAVRPATAGFCAYDSTRPRPSATARRTPGPVFADVLAAAVAAQAA